MHMLIAQGIGFVAVGFSLLTYLFNKRPAMLLSDTTAAFLYALHFFLLGAPVGGAMNLIGGARGLTFYKFPPTPQRRWLLWLFIAATAIATAIFWEGWISLLALAGTTCYAIAFWQLEPKYIRRWLLLSFPLWFIYNFLVGSYPGMLIEVLLCAGNLMGQYRFDAARQLQREQL